jgi:CheY-like chemotaxis protein
MRPDPTSLPAIDAPGSVAVLADDLIWASRLTEAVRRAGANPIRLGTASELVIALQASEASEPARSGPSTRLLGVIVDLFGRRYDGVTAVERVREARLPVIAVAEHDDVLTRKRALAAGARRVFSYNRFFTEGPRLVAAWLDAEQGVG